MTSLATSVQQPVPTSSPSLSPSPEPSTPSPSLQAKRVSYSLDTRPIDEYRKSKEVHREDGDNVHTTTVASALAQLKPPSTERPYPVPALPTSSRPEGSEGPDKLEGVAQVQGEKPRPSAQLTHRTSSPLAHVQSTTTTTRMQHHPYTRSPRPITINGIRAIQHLYVTQPSQSIKGDHFAISPYAPDPWPPRFDPPKQDIKDKSAASAVFESKGSAVNVKLYIAGLKGDEDDDDATVTEPEPQVDATGKNKREKRKPVIVNAKSYMSYVKLVIPDYPLPTTPLQIRAKSHNGSVSVGLPPSFSGLISWALDPSDTTSTISSLTFHPLVSLAHPREVLLHHKQVRISKFLRESGRVVEVVQQQHHQLVPHHQKSRGVDNRSKGLLKVFPASGYEDKDDFTYYSSAPAFRHSRAGSKGSIEADPSQQQKQGQPQQQPTLRGDLCELITTRGVLEIFDAREEEGRNGSCLVM